MQPESAPRRALIAFLQRVLPVGGTYFAVIQGKSGGFHHHDCVSIADLATELVDYPDSDIYFSTASFKDNLSRAASNVRELQAFRMDVDFGKGKPYATENAALVATVKFCQRANLPPPGFVLTGHGVHAWWPLNRPLARLAWERIAHGLAAVTGEFGLTLTSADHACIGDAARVLRCPGSLNFKDVRKRLGVPLEVKLHPAFFKCGPYDASQFEHVAGRSNIIELPSLSPVVPKTVLNAQSLAYYGSALDAIPQAQRDDRAVWLRIGAALYELGWAETGYELWTAWSSTSQKFDEADQLKTWESFGREYTGAKVTPGTIIHQAKEHGWHPPKITVAAQGEPLGVEQFAAHVLKSTGWATTKDGTIKERAYQNARVALARLDVQGRLNLFTYQRHMLLPWVSDKWQLLTDDVIPVVRKHIIDRCGFDPGKDNINDALEEFSNEGQYDPLKSYLLGLQWDGQKRLATWLTDYLGVAKTPVSVVFGLLFLCGAVRRIFQPGAKFDHMLILEGEQGIGKSMAVKALALQDYYRNGTLNMKDPRQLLEVMEGAWFYEWEELQGIRAAENEKLKAILSTTADTARLAYGRRTVNRPRRCVFVGTTNHIRGQYFTDQTGARRYWPVVCEKIDLDGLTRDIDQLYAEAVIVERKIGPLVVPKQVLPMAKEVQAGRTTSPEWMELLAGVQGERWTDVFRNGKISSEWERVSTYDIIVKWLGLQPSQVNPWTGRQIAAAMTANGWDSRNTTFNDGKQRRGWVRQVRGDD